MEIDIPDHIKDFIDKIVDSFVMWDLLIFSSQCADGIHTPQQTAQLLGRAEVEVEKPFSKLIELGIFAAEKQADGSLICRLNHESPLSPEVQRFVAFNAVQENRLRILSYLLHKKIN